MMHFKKIFSVVLVVLILGCIYVSTALPVDNRLTDADIGAIKSLSLSDACTKSGHRSFDDEIECLTSIQAAVQNIGEKRCASHSETIEPAEFIRRNYGCCFDRARFIEKAARYFGFETRHVFLIRPIYNSSLTNLIPLEQKSHATSEILTKKGWLGVDSNEPFIVLDASNHPYSYSDAVKNINEFPAMKQVGFYDKKPDVIYGLYSRHGNFHGLNLPGPEYVFSELLWNWR